MPQSGDMKSMALDAMERLPIRLLSEKTGVGASTLRAWERRYGMLTPERTPKGHRLYSVEDVRRVEHILTLLEEGHSLPAIAKVLEQGAEPTQPAPRDWEQAGVWSEYQKGTLQVPLFDASEARWPHVGG